MSEQFDRLAPAPEERDAHQPAHVALGHRGDQVLGPVAQQRARLAGTGSAQRTDHRLAPGDRTGERLLVKDVSGDSLDVGGQSRARRIAHQRGGRVAAVYGVSDDLPTEPARGANDEEPHGCSGSSRSPVIAFHNLSLLGSCLRRPSASAGAGQRRRQPNLTRTIADSSLPMQPKAQRIASSDRTLPLRNAGGHGPAPTETPRLSPQQPRMVGCCF